MSEHNGSATPADPPGPHTGAATAAWATTSAVCLGGATLSATKLFTLAEKAGWDATLAWLLFVILDGAALAGGLVWRYGRTQGARRYGAFVILESTVLSILGNVAAHLAEATKGLPMIVVLTVGAIVPIQIVLTVHMAMLMSERPDATTPTVDPMPVPTAPTIAELVAECELQDTMPPQPPTTALPAAPSAAAVDTVTEPAPSRRQPAGLVSVEHETGRPDWVTVDMAPSAAMRAYLDRHGDTPGAVLDRWAADLGLDQEFKPGLGRTARARWKAKRDEDRDTDGHRDRDARDVAVGEV